MLLAPHKTAGHYTQSRELWDLGRQFGALGGTMYWTKTTNTLPLFGEQTIGGHSVVIYTDFDEREDAYACATIEQTAAPPDQGDAIEHFGVLPSREVDIPKCTSGSAAAHVNSICCADGADCADGVPTECSVECAPVFVDFWDSCKRIFKGNAAAARSMHRLASHCSDIMDAMSQPASSADDLGEGCAWSIGDGAGGAEERVGTSSSPEECLALVRRDRPDANGATYKLGGFDCYAEMDMDSMLENAQWQTCLLDGSAVPPAPPPPRGGDGGGGGGGAGGH
eukprot:SAG22_NODE_519_length_9510_cov_6.192222_4_plen_281_part_00